MKLYRSPAAARGAVCGALILFVFAPIVFILVRSLENPVRTVITDLPGRSMKRFCSTTGLFGRPGGTR